MTTKTSTTNAPTRKRTTLKTESAKVSSITVEKSKKTTPTKTSTQKENIKSKVLPSTKFYPKAMQLVQLSNNSESGKSFFWEEYSQRCALISAEQFETVHYFAFPTEQVAIDFVNGISGKFCKECSYRSSKRFNPDEFPYEVKVWGMNQTTFFHLVKRDLERNHNN